MEKTVLVYPYFQGSRRSEFRFPPLGLGYIAAHLKKHRIEVEIVDCTFMEGVNEAVNRVVEMNPSIIGIYSMYTMREKALSLGRMLHEYCDLLVAGGPQPSSSPESFLDVFDVVVIGEGEEAMLELVKRKDMFEVRGIAFKEKDGQLSRLTGTLVKTETRELTKDLDSIPFPARSLFDNSGYIDYYRGMGMKPVTSIMSSRGCVFKCDFCSQPIFGNTFRERSPGNIVAEVEQILDHGYEKVVFQDDCFTLTMDRVKKFCNIVIEKGFNFTWECLSRVDTLDLKTARLMKKAGCDRIFFGIESGSDKILKEMNKQIDKKQAKEAVNSAKRAGIKAGAFFIIGYPGETDDTLLETVNFAGVLNLDYLSFNFPYPIPGTGLHKRVKYTQISEENHTERDLLVFKSEFSERKLRFAKNKGMTQHRIRKSLGPLAGIIYWPFRVATDIMLRLLE
jgi:anaerobic magnesium-protoporphyrin IX monomethyl ester cyclase